MQEIKKPDWRWLYTGWFQIYDILEKGKKETVKRPVVSRDSGWEREGRIGGAQVMLVQWNCFGDTVTVDTWHYVFVKTHRTV